MSLGSSSDRVHRFFVWIIHEETERLRRNRVVTCSAPLGFPITDSNEIAKNHWPFAWRVASREGRGGRASHNVLAFTAGSNELKYSYTYLTTWRGPGSGAGSDEETPGRLLLSLSASGRALCRRTENAVNCSREPRDKVTKINIGVRREIG